VIPKTRRRSARTAAIVAVLTLIALIAALMLGDYQIGPEAVMATLFGAGGGTESFLINEVRAPRALTAIGVGAAFGLSGAIFQSIVRNPLGTPELIGFTQGSSAGAVAGITLAGATGVTLTGWALAGGIATALAVWFFAFRRNALGYRLIIVGIGIGAMLNALTWWLLTRANLATAQSAMSWLIGSLSARSWGHVVTLIIVFGVLLVPLFGASRTLRILEMGDGAATGLGVRVPQAVGGLVALAVALCALAVSMAGPVAFIALAAPQIARRIARAPGVTLLNSALVGALLLLVSDLVALHAWPNVTLPVGVVTGVIGGIYLGWLLATGVKSAR